MTPELKARQLISQFGNNAKYVVLEIKDNLQWFRFTENYDSNILFWSKVKTIIENSH